MSYRAGNIASCNRLTTALLHGYIAHLPAIRQLDTKYELKAIYSRSQASASSYAKASEEDLALPPGSLGLYHDEGGHDSSLDALLARSDIQAVIVILPINIQPEIVLRALEAGKHVLSEKPIAPTVKDGIKLIRTYESVYRPKGLVWRVAENFESEPGLRTAGKAIANQKIGNVCFWNLQVLNHVGMDSMWYKTSWRTVPKYQGGFLVCQSMCKPRLDSDRFLARWRRCKHVHSKSCSS